MEKRKTAGPVEIKMEYIPESDGKVGPFIGYFPSGYDPTTKKNRKRHHEIMAYRHNKHPNRMQLVVRPEGSNVDFIGKSYAGEAAVGPQMCTYLLGVLDKEARTLKVVPIAANKIFRLEPRVEGVEYVNNELLEAAGNDPVTKENWRDKMENLTTLYGSKKNQDMNKRFRALEQQRNDPLSQQFLEDQLKETDVNEEPEEILNGIVENLPPHNPAAVKPEKAYLIDRIILKAEWPYLTDIDELLDSDSPDRMFQEYGYPTFVVNRISKVRGLEEKEKKQLTRILSYITHLVNFFHLSSAKDFKSKVRAGSTFGSIPRIISQRLVSLFVNLESFRVSTDKKTLLIYHILVLTLFVDEFHSPTKDIAVDLKIPYPQLKPYFMQLGCKVERDSVQSFMTLPVPLKFPGTQLERQSNRQRPRR